MLRGQIGNAGPESLQYGIEPITRFAIVFLSLRGRFDPTTHQGQQIIRIEPSRILQHSDRLELMKVAGTKGSRDELRRIAVALERIADRLEQRQSQPRIHQSDNLLNIEEAADYLRMSSKKLRQIVRRSRRRSEGYGAVGPTIQFQQDGARASIRFKQEWLDDYLDESTVSPSDGQTKEQPRRPKKNQRGDVELAEGKHINFDDLD